MMHYQFDIKPFDDALSITGEKKSRAYKRRKVAHMVIRSADEATAGCHITWLLTPLSIVVVYQYA